MAVFAARWRGVAAFVCAGMLIMSTGVRGSSPSFYTGQQKRQAGDIMVALDGNESVFAAAATDLSGTYSVRLPADPRDASFLQHLGKVVWKGQSRLIMEIDSELAPRVAGVVHRGAGCGGLVKLDRDGIGPVGRNRLAPPISPTDSVVPAVQRLVEGIDATRIKATVAAASSRSTRFHSSEEGLAFSDWLADAYRQLAQGRRDVSVSLYDHQQTRQKSVIVRIEGTESPDEVVVLGSHLDSVAFVWFVFPDDVAPGADDNASGLSTGLEVFRVLMQQDFRPKRTLEIHSYAAEEIGLIGSQEVAGQYARDRVNVVSMMQIDMSLYTNSQDRIWFIENNTNAALSAHAQRLTEAYTDLPWDTASLDMASSDHQSWHERGFAAVFPSEDPSAFNENLHSRDDTLSTSHISWSQAEGFARLAMAYVGHFAGVD